MKAIIEFDLSDEQDKENYDLANKAVDMQIALFEIKYDLFRQARKYGLEALGSPEINAIYQKLNNKQKQNVNEIVSLLEDKFYVIINNRKVNFE